MSSSTAADGVVCKRRPRQNIVSLILGHSRGSSSTISLPPQTNFHSVGDGKKKRRPSSSASASTRLLRSAMELTCRSKSFTTRHNNSASSRGKNSKTFVKGQRAFYRSNRGIEKVTVVGVHHDAKLVPYYTIQLRDGKEKQTDGKQLNHVKEDVVKKEAGGSSENNGKGKSGSESDRGSGGSGEAEGREVEAEGGGSKSTGSDNDTDPMTESSNESNVKDEVADSGKLARRESPGGESSLYENVKFTEGQDAYYRSPDGTIAKVRIRSLHPSNRFTISLPDGSQLQDVKQSHLATLMELSSKELSQLMKERNKRPPSSTCGSKSHNQRLVRRSSSSTHEESTITDKGNASEAEERLASSTSDLSDSLNELGSKKISESTTPAIPSSDSTESKEEKAQPLVPTVRMVEAKTEDGNSKTVPLYEAGMTLNYKNAAGVQECTIVSVHLDDLFEPYYDIRLADGHEKQTDNAHLMLKSDAVGEEQQQPSPPGEQAIPSSSSKKEASEDSAVNETPDYINRSDTQKHPKEDPATSTSVNNSTGFSIGNEVIYTSSEGEQIRAVVLKLQHDKKNRPYYVVRLHPTGKEKQVYGHRLQLCSPENNNSDEPQSRRSRSRLRGRSSSKTNESDDNAGDGSAGGGSNRRSDPAPRSESIDSRRSSLSNSSRRATDSQARRERDESRTDPVPRSESIDSRRSSLSNSTRRAADRKARHERDDSRTRERHTADPIGTTSRSRSMSAVRQGRTLGKSSSGGVTESRGSRERSRSRARGDGKERASSRAPSEGRDRSRSRAPVEGRERSCSRARSEGSPSCGTTPAQPSSNNKKLNISSGNVGAFSNILSSSKGKSVTESDSPSSKTAGKSIAKLKSFRRSFSAMKFR
ncbi:hypothetical protein ACHAXH_004686 [Discostella pseudostelligera]